MGGKTAIALGLVAGLVAGGAALGAAIVLVPDPPAALPSTPGPSPAASGALPSGPVPSGSPSIVPAGSAGSPSALASFSPPPSQSAPTASSGAPSSGSVADAFGVGRPAPALRLPLMGGGALDLATYRGRPVWVNFMATWCPPCQDELPLMAGYATRYGESADLVIIAVDVREDEATVQAFFQDLGVYLPVALDADGTAQAAWGALALPVHFWIDRDGIVREGALGGIGPDVMAQGLRSILPGVEVSP